MVLKLDTSDLKEDDFLHHLLRWAAEHPTNPEINEIVLRTVEIIIVGDDVQKTLNYLKEQTGQVRVFLTIL